MKDNEIVLEMGRIVASVGDAHTTLMPAHPETYHMFPLALQWFSDGLFVVGCPAPYAALLGHRVTAIGNASPDQAFAAVAPFLSAENDVWRRELCRSALINSELLLHVGLADSISAARYTAEGAGTVSVTSVPIGSMVALQTVLGAPGSVIPLYLQNTGVNYWSTTLDTGRIVYFQYNRCSDAATQPFRNFLPGLLAEIDAHPSARLIVDLRLNSGGNSTILDPFIDSIRVRTVGTTSGRLFVFIGPKTFSSGLLNAIELKTGTPAVLVGEPSGGKPDAYGEVQTFSLPHSGVTIGYSTKYFSPLSEDVPSLLPDVDASISYQLYAAGRDPALEYVRSH